jgi:peroxin-19
VGEKEDYDQVIDGMMRQLLSKELMYDPMKQVCKKYPMWLAEAKAQLTDEEYKRYGMQYQYFQRIVACYETTPDNYPRLMELMNDIQEYGQPPSEIIKELAPGLSFNEQGLPIMPGMGNSMMPDGTGGVGEGVGGAGLGQVPGIPLPGGDAGQCMIS